MWECKGSGKPVFFSSANIFIHISITLAVICGGVALARGIGERGSGQSCAVFACRFDLLILVTLGTVVPKKKLTLSILNTATQHPQRLQYSFYRIWVPPTQKLRSHC